MRLGDSDITPIALFENGAIGFSLINAVGDKYYVIQDAEGFEDYSMHERPGMPAEMFNCYCENRGTKYQMINKKSAAKIGTEFSVVRYDYIESLKEQIKK